MNVIAWGGIAKGFNENSIGGSAVTVGKLCPEMWNGDFPFYFSAEAIL